MAFDFPQTPALGEEYTSNGQTYTYTGVGWGVKSNIITQGENDIRYVNISGDTMTGDLTISKSLPVLNLVKPIAAEDCSIFGWTGAFRRWKIVLGSASTESGGNAGSDFTINSRRDDGTALATPLAINRATGSLTHTGTFASLAGGNAGGLYPPTDAPRFAVGWNQSSGNREISVFNTDTAGSGFQFKQMNSTTSSVAANIICGAIGSGAITCGAITSSGSINCSALTTGAITASGGIAANGGTTTNDISIIRASVPNTGYAYFGNTSTIYFGYDGSSFVSSAQLYINGVLSVTGRTIVNNCMEVASTGGWIFGLQAIPGSLYIGQSNGAGGIVTNYTRWDSPGNFLNYSGAAYKPGGGPWTDSSDVRIKNVIGDYEGGLDEVLKLNPVRFTFKGNDTLSGEAPSTNAVPIEGDGPETKEGLIAPYANSPHYQPAQSGQEFIGLIAQAAEIAFPEMVTKRAGRIDGVEVTDLRDIDTTPLIFALVNAMKTLTERVVQLEMAR